MHLALEGSGGVWLMTFRLPFSHPLNSSVSSLKTLELLASSSISLRQACLVRFFSSFSDPVSGQFVKVEDPTLHTLHPDLATSTKFICTGNGLPGKAGRPFPPLEDGDSLDFRLRKGRSAQTRAPTLPTQHCAQHIAKQT